MADILTDDAAQQQLNWMLHDGPRQLFHRIDMDMTSRTLTVRDSGISKLREISKICEDLADYFEFHRPA
jgi:hypothetical protein